MARLSTPSDDAGRLYPDVVDAGGLAPALQIALRSIASDLSVTDLPQEHRFVAYARVQRGVRASQVYIAAERRLFLNDFWRDGVNFANGSTSDLSGIAHAIHCWVAEECAISALKQFSFVTLADFAESFDQQTEVEDRWKLYLKDIGYPELESIVAEAATRFELRQLFPFTSLNRLCFSRCTGYPYTRDTPHIEPIENGHYNVRDAYGKLIGTGDAKLAADMLVGNLPANCGPAIRGTADTIKST
ncbi:MAG: DUF6193 family natural product biosynthesis protein [Pirellulales bacterium]